LDQKEREINNAFKLLEILDIVNKKDSLIFRNYRFIGYE